MPKPERDFRTASRESWKLFKKAHPQLAKKINSTTYIKIVKGFNEGLIKYALDTGNQIFLPYNFGVICVHRWEGVNFKYKEDGTPQNIMAINWPETNRLGKRVFLLNNHTEGFRYRFLWRTTKRLPMRDIWCFHATRVASRELARRLKEETEKYKYMYHDWRKADNQIRHHNR